MGPTARRHDAWLILLISTSLLAWSMLAFADGDLTLPSLCSAGTLWAPSDSLHLVLVLNSPAKFVSGWALMVAAMMPPLIIAPLRYVRDRSFARRRAPAMMLFVAGYAAVWMTAGLGLQAVALAMRWAVPAPLLCLGLAAGVALGWQVSPAKQWCLNRCHRRPHLAAFGAVASRDAFNFGLTHAASCAGACWALMLLTLLAGPGHFLAMIAVTLLVFAERLEGPAPLEWRWRGTAKAWRIVTTQARLRLAPRRVIGEASR
jgi:predicted metal-binding membrane protein